jgi:DNA-binding NtrC family response regulator
MFDVLLVDDDGELLQSLARALSPRISPLRLNGATTSAAAHALVQQHKPCVIVLDLCIDERQGVESGFELLASCRKSDPTSRIIVLTGHGSLAHGVRALTLGAASFMEKPAEPEHLAAVITDAASQSHLRRECEKLSHQAAISSMQALAGQSDAMKLLRDRLAFVATTPQPVLLIGETGTGKGLCARLIHDSSPRRLKRFVQYQPNFGGGDLVQSELFGHVKGAFTGALETRQGLAVEADHGTLFLDELDEIPVDAQVRLLDLVQEQRVRPVGSDVFKKVDCRCIAATNRPLDEALVSNKIRRDLYHRLAYNVLHIPPLRDRLADVGDLCEETLRGLRAREVVQVFDIHPDVIERFKTMHWPGNVRELKAVVESAAYHAHFKGRTAITREDIPAFGVSAPLRKERSFHEQVECFKAQLIEQALQQCRGSQVQAAKMLGLDRGTLRRIVGRGGAAKDVCES